MIYVRGAAIAAFAGSDIGSALRQRTYAAVVLALNVSPALVVDRHDELEALLRTAGAPVILELTEHDAVEDYGALHDALVAFDPSVRVSVDDAGAGFASLRHVVMLDPDFIKLDRSWIAGIDADAPRQALVAGLAHFAAVTGATLVAEGIETERELAAVAALEDRVRPGLPLRPPRPGVIVGGELDSACRRRVWGGDRSQQAAVVGEGMHRQTVDFAAVVPLAQADGLTEAGHPLEAFDLVLLHRAALTLEAAAEPSERWSCRAGRPRSGSAWPARGARSGR